MKIPSDSRPSSDRAVEVCCIDAGTLLPAPHRTFVARGQDSAQANAIAQTRVAKLRSEGCDARWVCRSSAPILPQDVYEETVR